MKLWSPSPAMPRSPLFWTVSTEFSMSYGGVGAYDRKDHVSNRFISEEIAGLKASSRTVPPLFLAVAAFLLYIVISRMIQSEREQIGLMKAFGYSSLEVAVHYGKFVLAIASGGAVLGCLLGILAGRSMAVVYLEYFKFPFLVFQVDPSAFVTGILSSILAASAGGVLVLRGVFALTPAVAMRPPAPPDFSKSAALGSALKSLLDQPSRMVVRRLIRQPIRALTAVVGIACGMALSVAMLSVMASFEDVLELNFSVIDRSDVTVSFAEPLGGAAIYRLARMPGVIEVEPYRAVPALLRNGLNTYRGAVNGLVTEPRLNRAVNSDMSAIYVRGDGVILAKPLAKILDIRPGQTLTIEVREGRRPVVEMPVAAIAQTLLGAPAYVELDALNRVLKEPDRASGAYLRIDSAQSEDGLSANQGHADCRRRQPPGRRACRLQEADGHGRRRHSLRHGGDCGGHHVRHRLQQRPHRLCGARARSRQPSGDRLHARRSGVRAAG